MSSADLSGNVSGRRSQQTSPRSTWPAQLRRISSYATAVARDEPITSRISGRRREAWFVLNVAESRRSGQFGRRPSTTRDQENGDFGKIKKLSVRRDDMPTVHGRGRQPPDRDC